MRIISRLGGTGGFAERSLSVPEGMERLGTRDLLDFTILSIYLLLLFVTEVTDTDIHAHGSTRGTRKYLIVNTPIRHVI